MDLAATVTWISEYTNLALDFLAVYLPDSPFIIPSNSPIAPYLGYINYFVPIGDMLRLLYLWGVAILFYYDCQIIMRWFKVIS
jgi:hypothetical protein